MKVLLPSLIWKSHTASSEGDRDGQPMAQQQPADGAEAMCPERLAQLNGRCTSPGQSGQEMGPPS